MCAGPAASGRDPQWGPRLGEGWWERVPAPIRAPPRSCRSSGPLPPRGPASSLPAPGMSFQPVPSYRAEGQEHRPARHRVASWTPRLPPGDLGKSQVAALGPGKALSDGALCQPAAGGQQPGPPEAPPGCGPGRHRRTHTRAQMHTHTCTTAHTPCTSAHSRPRAARAPPLRREVSGVWWPYRLRTGSPPTALRVGVGPGILPGPPGLGTCLSLAAPDNTAGPAAVCLTLTLPSPPTNIFTWNPRSPTRGPTLALGRVEGPHPAPR